MQGQMAKSAKSVFKLVPNKRLENITKVTFETESGKSFTLIGARVWKLNFLGNLAYQIRGEHQGEVPDLEEMLKEDVKQE
jgi:hypothetical protein